MIARRLRTYILTLSLVLSYSFFYTAYAQEPVGSDLKEMHQSDTMSTEGHEEGKFDPAAVIMEHVLDAHEFHFFSIGEHHYSIPLPVILYSPQRGLSVFSYGRFEHGHKTYEGYKSEEGKIEPVKADGSVDEGVTFYDFSMTRNVVQLLLSLVILCVLMIGIANKYKKNGAHVAPSGFQNAVEPVITFVRDEVGKPNLGRKYEKYMPYLLTVFFFILINNLIGLVPGTANVTGNIAFTMVLAIISLVIILLSTNSHFWGHILWPPGVPVPVKLILIPVELLGVLVIKPAALMIRLFANMIAGHIVITCFILLIFIFGAMSSAVGWGFSPISIAFTVFIYLIEILVAFIQAFIFTNLTAVFIGQSFEGSHDDVDGHADQIVI